MTGTGSVRIEGFMESIVCKRIEDATKRQQGLGAKGKLALTKKDIKEFLTIASIFDLKHGLNYATFKKFFFPQLCHATLDEREGDDMDSMRGEQERNDKEQLKKNKDAQPKILQDRISQIERVLRKKL